MKKLLATSSLTVLAAACAYANSNAASLLYICSIPQNTNLAQADFEALSWTAITGVGSVGETGISTNVLTYDTWDTTVTQKAKGVTDAGSPELELARIPTDAGQILLRTAGAVGNNNNYAFKMLRSDGTTSANGTVIYNRGLVMGPKRPNGRNEDFDLEMFTLGLQQQEVVVAPSAAGIAPFVTAVPAITGTATVGQTLTCSTGTWSGDVTITYSYQWYQNNVAINGATAGTYVLLAAQLGKRITARVVASNASGNGISTTAPTAAVA